MKLYHGTNYSSAIDICLNGVDLSQSQKFLDFGPGFYTTPNYSHAAVTAIRKTNTYNAKHKTSENPYIVTIDVDFSNPSAYNILRFPHHGLNWMNFVINNRLSPHKLSEYSIIYHNQQCAYDIVYGEVADNAITSRAYQINSGTMSPKDIKLEDIIKNNRSVYAHQYSFHTKKSICCIKYYDCAIITNKDSFLRKKV